jgi:glycosyltransferase involved in cell wall biosynthesis
MRVLFLTSTLPRFAGDMQADFVGHQAQAWAAARPNDQVIVLAPGSDGVPTQEHRCSVEIERFIYMRPRRFQRLAYPAILPNIKRNPWLALQLAPFLVAQYRAARRLVKEREIDLVYAHWVMPQGLVAWRLKRATGVPYVLQNHSSDLAVFAKPGAPGEALARRILEGASAFFCVNRSQLDFACGLFEGEARARFAAKAHVLPMGVEPLPEPNARAGWDYDLATIGRLSRKKGLDLLIAAAERLAADGLRPRIGIAGDGEDRAALEALVDRADIAFPGFITGPDKAAFLKSPRAFVFSNLAQGGDVEGMPVALLEAMAGGKPVLASRDTNIAMLPEWDAIRDAVEYIENPRDIAALAAGMKRLLSLDADERARRSRVLADAIGRYRWERLIGEYHAAILGAL